MNEQQANKKLWKEINKKMPKNSSYSMLYNQEKIIAEKRAKAVDDQQDDNSILFTARNQTKQVKESQENDPAYELKLKKQKARKYLLNQILNNKVINFKPKKPKKITPKSNNQLESLNQVPDSPCSQNQQRFLFFPPSQSPINQMKTPTNFPAPYHLESYIGAQKKTSLPQIHRSNKISRGININSSFSNSKQNNSTLKNNFSSIDSRKPRSQSTLSMIPTQNQQRFSFYCQTLRNLQEVSSLESVKSRQILQKSLKNQQKFHSVYQELNSRTIQVVYGYTEFKLDEEKLSLNEYKEQLRNMWMATDLRRIKKMSLIKKSK